VSSAAQTLGLSVQTYIARILCQAGNVTSGQPSANPSTGLLTHTCCSPWADDADYQLLQICEMQLSTAKGSCMTAAVPLLKLLQAEPHAGPHELSLLRVDCPCDCLSLPFAVGRYLQIPRYL